MSLKTKIILLTLLPLIVISVAITTIYQRQTKILSEQEIATFERNLLASKRTELKHYVELALATIDDPLSRLTQGASRSTVEQEVKEILSALHYGEDGYFFAYSMDGVNHVHPVQPYLIGQNLLDIQDSDGKHLIRNLLHHASQGGGYERYKWRKPSKNGTEDKLAYVVNIPELGWMLGTGIYLDDVMLEVSGIREDVENNIQNTLLTVSGIVAISVIVIILTGLIINIRETQLANRRLQEIAQNSLKLQVNQRRAFSRELHDGINQLLVSTRLWINLVDKKWGQDVARQHLQKAMGTIDQAMVEVRRVSHDLRPVLMDDLGLEAALKEMLKGLSERQQIRVITRIHLQQSLPDILEITIYRIIQEALTNIEKHSGATEISVSVQMHSDVVTLTIEDNGVGIPKRKKNGLGLNNMKERAELLGGTLQINYRNTPRENGKKNPLPGTSISAIFYLTAVYKEKVQESYGNRNSSLAGR
ncbi:cache domain-containing protein [Endozoicomonas sp. SESOKO1]|uniref:cache domain-containing protein n=1 Tax=Endozoicomonas sp. SESOKO1 TaxID=2828742 RepID=UPI002148FED3